MLEANTVPIAAVYINSFVHLAGQTRSLRSLLFLMMETGKALRSFADMSRISVSAVLFEFTADSRSFLKVSIP